MVAAMRKTAFISVKHLAEKELLRYELLMQLADEKTVFRWLQSDLRFASVALLDSSAPLSQQALPANCLCIWVSASPDHHVAKGDMILPVNFRLPDLINVLDRAALRILDMKPDKVGPDNSSDPLFQSTYRISRWISLEHDFSTVNFQKILAVMTKQAIDWQWLLVYGGLSERDAYLFLDELRRNDVLVELSKLPLPQELAQKFYPEQKESGVGFFVKKITQWLSRTRSQELEITR